jgi:nucleotide-binding universal stress UspA family protein
MDNLFSRIIVGVDDSEPAIAAVAYAARLARDHDGELVLASVINWVSLTAQAGSDGAAIDAESIIAQLNEGAQAALDRGSEIARHFGITVERRTPDGDPAETLMMVAHEEKATLIVMGTHGRRGVGRMFLGSTAEMVLRGSSVPVLTLRSAIPPEREAQRCLSRILIGIDDSEPSDAALNAVFALPVEDRRELLIYSAADVGASLGLARPRAVDEQHFSEADAIVERAVTAARKRNINARGSTVAGHAADVIVGAAAAEVVDLIVLGSHGRRGLPRFVLGSVAENVVRAASVPVLVVRAAKGGGHTTSARHGDVTGLSASKM